jgi:ferrochelatase
MKDIPARVLVLANLGTPASATPAAVAAYLDEFLSDPRVVQLPRWLWKPLLRRVILPRRSPATAAKYAAIWMEGGSPLAVLTRRLAQAVQARLPGCEVLHAMRYGEPALAVARPDGP